MSRFSQFRYSSGLNSGSAQPGSLLGRAVAFVLGIIVLAVSIFVGAVFFTALLGLILIFAVIFMLRVWWLKRKMQTYTKEHGDLDAEYTVIQEGNREIHHETQSEINRGDL
jgi:high-affinity Fe2+/Pb2+ permease